MIKIKKKMKTFINDPSKIIKYKSPKFSYEIELIKKL